MTDPIRVLHFADTHIGMENYGKTDPTSGLSSRVVDFLHRMDDICNYAKEQDADLIVFAGDAFKTRAPSPTFQREFAYRIRDLAEIAPVVLLIGNHDLPLTQMKASSVEIFATLDVHNVRVASEYETFVINTKRGDVLVGTAPYPLRARILENTKTNGLTIAETDARLQEQLVHILEEMAEQADAQGDMPRLLTGHFTVGGALVGSERSIMLGRDVSVPRDSLADSRWDYVALGHIHKHQNLTAGREDVPAIVYSGSIERIDFGEEGDPKGFCWVELARDATTWDFIRLEKVRPFVTLRADLRDDEQPTRTVLQLIEKHNLDNAVVRFILQFSQTSETRFNENAIRDALKRSGAFHIAGIRKEVEQPARARLGGSPEGMTPDQLLERYLQSQEIPPERRNELLEVAESIFDQLKDT
ncbi:MAG: exonuclease SbcCD subunit D [Aggregatilineales bacterium]